MQELNFFVNFICYTGIVALTVYDGYTYWTRGGRDHVSLKGEMTGIGILGTFAGIFLGLMSFNVHNIPESIPLLLEGLKTAFGTSIAGLFCSTGMTVAQALKPAAFRKTGDPVADTLVRVFQEFEPLIAELRDATHVNSTEIVAMRHSMETTMDKLAEGVTDEIIKALEGVISDFNKNLTEQFGDNFKRLNDACFKLVEWQENHIPTLEATTKSLQGALDAFQKLREQTETMLGEHKELLAALGCVGEGASDLSNSAGEIHTTCKKLENLFAGIERLIESLKTGIENTDKVFGHAVEGFERKTREVAEATHLRSERAAELLINKSNEAGTAFKESLDNMISAFIASSSIVKKDLEEIPRIGSALENAAVGAENAARAATAAATAAREANESAGKTINLTNGQMETAHKNLQDALVALTNGFGHAYREYLDGLRKLADQ